MFVTFLTLNKQNTREIDVFDEFLNAIGNENTITPVYADSSLTHLRKKSYTKVVHDCTYALVINPYDKKVIWRRGLAYLRLGHPHLANRDWEHSLELDPNNTYIQKSLHRLKEVYYIYRECAETWQLRHLRVASSQQLPVGLRKQYPNIIRGKIWWKKVHDNCQLCGQQCELKKENLSAMRSMLYMANTYAKDDTENHSPSAQIGIESSEDELENKITKGEHSLLVPEELYRSNYPCPQNIDQFLYMIKVLSAPCLYIETFSFPISTINQLFKAHGMSVEQLNLFLKSIHYIGLCSRFCKQWSDKARSLMQALSGLPWFSFVVQHCLHITAAQILLHIPDIQEEEFRNWHVSKKPINNTDLSSEFEIAEIPINCYT
nr:pi018 [Schizosaccharomyces pombe]